MRAAAASGWSPNSWAIRLRQPWMPNRRTVAVIACAAMAAVGASDRCSSEANNAARRALVMVCRAGVPGSVLAMGPEGPPGAIRALRRGPGAVSPAGHGGQDPGSAMPGPLPSGLSGGAGLRIALGLALQFGHAGLPQGPHRCVLHHRGLLGCGTELDLEDAAKAGRRGSGDRPGSGTLSV